MVSYLLSMEGYCFGGDCGAGLGLVYSLVKKKPVYTATLSYALEDEEEKNQEGIRGLKFGEFI
jgi:hypothetical protein